MTGLFSTLALIGLLNLSPVPFEGLPSSHVENISDGFEAGGMIAVKVREGSV